MVANKSISKHKGLSLHKSKTAQPAQPDGTQAFDIIPRNKVKPSATARPVITGTQPAAPDTTLRQPVITPVLDLDFNGRLGGGLTRKHAAAVDDAADRTGSEGVPVSELMAKRQASKAATTPHTVVRPEPAASEPAPATALPDDTPTGAADTPAVVHAVPETSAAPPPADDSVESVLEVDTDAPQEHSESLKDAIKDLEGQDLRHHELYEGKPVIVVHHKHRKHPVLTWLLWFILSVILALAVVNFLLDAGLITTDYIIPHTDIL